MATTTLRDNIRRLVGQDLIRRTPNPSDGRSYLIELTDNGARLIAAADPDAAGGVPRPGTATPAVAHGLRAAPRRTGRRACLDAGRLRVECCRRCESPRPGSARPNTAPSSSLTAGSSSTPPTRSGTDIGGRWVAFDGNAPFEQLGIGIHVLRAGEPNGKYHSEPAGGLLVLSGECILLVEGEERRLAAWDFVHCPPGSAPHLRRRGRRAVRHPDGRSACREQEPPLPGRRDRRPLPRRPPSRLRIARRPTRTGSGRPSRFAPTGHPST